MGKMTYEQLAVIHHPIGHHARVLAVAGSGKTTTMVLRIRELVQVAQVNPATILVLMFNKLAREQFRAKLDRFGIPKSLQPEVHTFHSYAYKLIQAAMTRGLLPRMDTWTGDKEELARIHAHRAIEQLIRRGELPVVRATDVVVAADPGDEAYAAVPVVDCGEVLEAIGLWKGSLIPPERAGYRGDPAIPVAYGEFERLRVQANALTFDDYVPTAVELLDAPSSFAHDYREHYAHLIVDEYQDINYGQQRLIELLAGRRADVMVVGDDDQTIYEWRGARPRYLIREFRTVFDTKPHSDYTLSQSFRFGPIVAQCAHNVISFNTERVPKPLVAHDHQKATALHIVRDSSEQATDVNKALADQVEVLIREQGVAPTDVIVLGRMFVQLSGLEMEFMARQLPYHVDGQAPFFERREIRVLLDYVRVAQLLDRVPPKDADHWLLTIANTPSRKLRRELFRSALTLARMRKQPLVRALLALIDDPDSHLSRPQTEKLQELIDVLVDLREQLDQQPEPPVGAIFDWLIDRLPLAQHYDHYYGQGEESYERKHVIIAFARYATRTGLTATAFLQHLSRLDPTQGAAEHDQVCLTTIFRTKGLEYDYVVLPECEEGFMPCLIGAGARIYDTSGQVQEPEASQAIENERRLFYVALTRAKRSVYIGVSERPTLGLVDRKPQGSRFLEEIQREVVTAVMQPLQRLFQAEPGAEEALVRAVTQHGGHGWVKQSLVANYLTRLDNPALTGRLATAIAAAPDVAFAYRHAYASAPLPRMLVQPAADEDLPF